MKKNTLFSLLSFLLVSQVFFSCNTARQYEFSNTGPAYHSEKAFAKTPEVAPIENANTTGRSETLPADLTASSGQASPVAAEPLVDLKKTSNSNKAEVNNIAATPQKINLNKADKKELKQLFKGIKKQNSISDISSKPTVDIVELIFAILLPPVGVLLHDGGITVRFWISLVLTLLFFFPGMIYAILVVTDTI